MPINRWDIQSTKEEESKMETVDDIAEQMKKPLLAKTPSKRKREDKKLEAVESAHKKRLEWVQKKAKEVSIPTEDEAVIKPSYFYKDHGPYLVNMCLNCRIFNSEREMETVKEGMVQLPMALCTVCRSHLNHQRSSKFFHFDLPNIKKSYNL